MPRNSLQSSTPQSSTSSLETREKSLEFSVVQVFEFPATVGDNPYVSSGCPISLDWQSQKQSTIGIEDFESQHRRKSKSKDAMKLSVSDRAEM